MEKTVKIEDIKTFENACNFLNLKADKVLPDLSMYPENHREGMLAHSKLVLIVEAINTIENNGERWIPNWDNWNEYKYYPWFNMGSPSGVGFSYLGFDNWFSYSGCGSRLCFKTAASVRHVAKEFLELYKSYYVI